MRRHVNTRRFTNCSFRSEEQGFFTVRAMLFCLCARKIVFQFRVRMLRGVIVGIVTASQAEEFAGEEGE